MMKEQTRRQELADFLRVHRSRLTPGDVGLPRGERRRVRGLRREEVAELAGIGVTWYTWLEQARSANVSAQTLERIALALRLQPQEREHLFVLAGQSPPLTPQREEVITPAMRQVLEQLEPSPAYIVCARWDVLASNRAARQVFGDFDARPVSERNLLWLAFTDPNWRSLFIEWERFARCLLTHFRADYGQLPGEPRWVELVAALRQVSPEFAAWWDVHDVARPADWRKEINHPEIGHLSLDSLTLQVHATTSLRLTVHVPAPETATDEKLKKLMAQTSNVLVPMG